MAKFTVIYVALDLNELHFGFTAIFIFTSFFFFLCLCVCVCVCVLRSAMYMHINSANHRIVVCAKPTSIAAGVISNFWIMISSRAQLISWMRSQTYASWVLFLHIVLYLIERCNLMLKCQHKISQWNTETDKYDTCTLHYEILFICEKDREIFCI